MPHDLPSRVCFRVTRACNARCSFCLAPPLGLTPAVSILKQRIDWLLNRGVDTIHFCGGEPTIHPGLPELVQHVHACHKHSKLTTNAISLPDDLVPILRSANTLVKVSLHGDREHHDQILGRAAFEHTTKNIRRLITAGVSTSVQTTVIARATWVVDWVSGFCLEAGVRRLSFLPFIPRGSGYERRMEYGFTSAERRELRDHVARLRRSLGHRLEVRWLDFTARPIHVVEPDGKVILEGATEALDKILYEIPATEHVASQV
jgi:MoaA/NifB/PqqE/SkfB family radical SAM enzyme